MAVITPNTFDPLRRYIGVRLQQGVPIVDADWNEMEDVRQFELRAFLKWFVGDGVPEGNDGFWIEGTGLANDFIMRVGVGAAPGGVSNVEIGLRHVGRCIVDGLDVLITADANFTAQSLHESQPGAAAVAVRLGVPQVVALSTPLADVTVVAYLDVWQRLVTPTEDPSLVHTGLGTESCARFRREWVVRVRNGTSVPVPADPDYIAGHSYYALATIARWNGAAAVNPGDVTDRRERRLFVPPATLITDVFGLNASDYRRGLGRPVISFREAINALMRGELPSTRDAAMTLAPGVDAMRRGALFDNTNGIVAVWTSDRFGGTDQILAARLDMADVPAGFTATPVQITSGVAHDLPHAALLPNGDLVAVYQVGGFGAAADLAFKRAPLAGLNAAAEQILANTAGVAESSPFVVVSGIFMVFFYHLGGATNRWQYRRRRHTDNAWQDANPVQLSAMAATVFDFHAARDQANNIWSAFLTGNDVRAQRLNPATAVVDQEITLSTGAAVLDEHTFVLCASGGDVWVFWNSPNALHHALFRSGAWQPGPVPTVPNTMAGDREPTAVQAADGGIWLFWARGAVGAGDIFFMRREPATGTWGQPRQMTVSAGDDSGAFALMASNNAIWMFWSSDRDGNSNPYFKRLVTAL